MSQFLNLIAADPSISPAFKAAVCPRRRHNDPKPAEASHLDPAPAVAPRPDEEPDADDAARERSLVTFDATAFCRNGGRAER